LNEALPLTAGELRSRWRFDLLFPTLFRPRGAFARIIAAESALWQTPIVILLVTGLMRTLVTGALRQAAAQAGGPVLPPGFEYYTPEQQAQFMQAMAATSGPIFVYLLPAVMTVLGVLFGWLILSGVLYLGMTLVGGRAGSMTVRNVTAWALLPFALRDMVRAVAMWSSGAPLTVLGLSGFAPVLEGGAAIYVTALLALVDLYLLWHLLLLLIGIRAGDNLSRLKSWSVVLVTVLALYALRALPALIAAQFSELTVIRPFF
jgi:hypothetical protein